MTSKEALREMCVECEREMGKNKVACPFRSISNEYCNEYNKIANDLKILDILKYDILYVDEKGRIAFRPIISQEDRDKIQEWLDGTREV